MTEGLRRLGEVLSHLTGDPGPMTMPLDQGAGVWANHLQRMLTDGRLTLVQPVANDEPALPAPTTVNQEVVSFLRALRDTPFDKWALPLATREQDKARQFCARWGLAEFNKGRKGWAITGRGRRTLAMVETTL